MLRLDSSWRCRRPVDTLSSATALMQRLGISRVVDITRMDRLGLPVYASVRPRGKGLCVNAGKGVNALQARIGALMEAIEFSVAEPQATDWEDRRLGILELAAQLDDGLRLADFSPRFGLKPDPQTLLSTVPCKNITSGRTVRLPAELVFYPYAPAPAESLYSSSTTGLASGNTLEEATIHALLEVLERDAVVMNWAGGTSKWVPPQTLPAPFAGLSSTWQSLGVALAVRYLPNELSLPCFEAIFHEPGSNDVNLACGSGLHLDRKVALVRAICEAAQSRLSHIHGGRDDITHFYDKYSEAFGADRAAVEAATIAKAFDTTRSLPFDQAPTFGQILGSAAEVLARLTARVATAGFKAIYRHRFRIELGGLQVVKIIVPGCEELDETRQRIGPRLYRRLAEHA